MAADGVSVSSHVPESTTFRRGDGHRVIFEDNLSCVIVRAPKIDERLFLEPADIHPRIVQRSLVKQNPKALL